MTVSVLDWERRYRKISKPASPTIDQSIKGTKQDMTIDEFMKKRKQESIVLGITKNQFRAIAQEWRKKNM